MPKDDEYIKKDDEYIKKLEDKLRADNVVVINFLDAPGYGSIIDTLRENQEDQIISGITGEEFMSKNQKLAKKSGNVKIYIIVHSHGGASSVRTDSGEFIPYLTLAKKLADFIGEESVVVNLISCAAGRGEVDHPHKNTNKSFAAKLHGALTELTERDIPVIARTQIMSVGSGFKTTYPIYDAATQETIESGIRISKQPGSKIIITRDDSGEQVKLDAYQLKWKSQLLTMLKNAVRNTAAPDKKAFLLDWIKQFKPASAHYIAQRVKDELIKSDSPLFLHSNPLSSLFANPRTHANLEEHMKKWDQIVTPFISEPTIKAKTADLIDFDKLINEGVADIKILQLFHEYTDANPKNELSFRKFINSNLPTGQALRKATINALAQHSPDGHLGLHYLLLSSPSSLLTLLQTSDASEKKALVSALTNALTQTSDSMKGIDLICKLEPHILGELYKSEIKSDSFVQQLALAVFTPVSEKKPVGLLSISHAIPGRLNNFIERLLDSDTNHKQIVKIIDDLLSDNQNHWQQLLEMSKKSRSLINLEAISSGLCARLEKMDDDRLAWMIDVIKAYSPSSRNENKTIFSSFFKPAPDNTDLVGRLLAKADAIQAKRAKFNPL